jgi:KDO2-lipid IV(A) lauroyltransferase
MGRHMTRKDLGFRLEAVVVWIIFHLFKVLPIDAASALGGWIGRTIGRHLPVTRHARRNLQRVFPEWSAAEREACVARMWDNLGRTAGEYPHITEFTFGPGSRMEMVGLDHLLALRDDGQPGIFFSAHCGNWELCGLSAARNGLPISLIYRAASNPYVNWIFEKGRSTKGIDVIPKGSAGARTALSTLKRGGHLGMLVDQKMNDGISVPFFGMAAMTAPAVAVFALKYRCPVVPAHVVRIKGAHFRIIFEPPMQFEATGDHHADVLQAMTAVNLTIERWVREQPDQWLWLHKRWPD